VSSFFHYNIRYTPLDTVNVMFSGFDSFNEILTVLAGDGWGSSNQISLYLEEDNNRIKTEDAYLTRPRGLISNAVPRLHVRFWQNTTNVMACAHRERAFHIIRGVDLFDAGKLAIENAFMQANQRAGRVVYLISHNQIKVTTPVVDPPSDGYATMITKI